MMQRERCIYITHNISSHYDSLIKVNHLVEQKKYIILKIKQEDKIDILNKVHLVDVCLPDSARALFWLFMSDIKASKRSCVLQVRMN